jgi:hypothetical protein
MSMTRLSPPIAIHGFVHFPARFFFAFVGAAIPGFFALGQSDFALGDAVAKIDAQGYDG